MTPIGLNLDPPTEALPPRLAAAVDGRAPEAA